MFYDVKNIVKKIVIMPEYKDNNKEIKNFFLGDNLFNVLKINEIYTHDKMEGVFIEDKYLKQLFMLAKNTFKVDFNIDSFLSGKAPINKVESKTEDLIKHNVSSHEEVKKIIKIHAEDSTYAKNKTKTYSKSQLKRIERDKELKINALKRKKENEINYNKATDLSFEINHKKIISIDFEFKILDNEGFFVTECGISISNKGVVSNQHFLIKENYQTKRGYKAYLQEQFLFGKTRIIPEDMLGEILEKNLENADIVIFHEKREDIQILEQFGIELVNSEKLSIMDTQLCYKRHFIDTTEKNKQRITLEDLLEGLKIKNEFLHNSGNDAHYTLQLLLKMSQIFLLRESLMIKNTPTHKM